MKTERRHDLETNSLAVRLTRWIERLKPYTGQMLIGVLVLVAVSAISSMWGNYSTAQQQHAWDAYALANFSTDPELLGMQRAAESEEYAGTPMQEWAYLVWADRQLLLAAQSFLFDSKGTKDRLRQAEGIFDELETGAGNRQLRDRARFGLARVYELQNKIDEARRQYALVQGDLKPLAAARAEQLESGDAKATFDWLASAELPKQDPTGGAGATGGRPSFDATIPGAAPGGQTGPPRGLEDLLGDFGSNPFGEDRYGDESDESATTDAAETGEMTDDSAEDSADEAVDNTAGNVDDEKPTGQ